MSRLLLALCLSALPATALAQGPIAFVSDRDIYVMNPDGSNPTRLTFSDSNTFCSDPAWSPDRSKIAFMRETHTVPQPTPQQIYVMNADGSNVVNVSNLPDASAADKTPAWSPDGTRIAFASTRFGNVGIVGNVEIVVMNADGSGVTRLTSTSVSVVDTDPTWSPDSTKIAFATNRDGNYEVYSMNAADGTGLLRLTNRPGNDLEPAWGASGEILFRSVLSATGNLHVHKMNPDGSGVTALPPGISPHW